MLLFDVDNDGDLDLLTVGAGGQHLYRNDGGRFSDVTRGCAPDGAGRRTERRLRWPATTTTTGDRTCSCCERPAVCSCTRRADGTFEDVTANAGLATQSLRSRAAAWVDVDHDGDLDLVVGSPLHLWRNNGDGKFTDITTDAGLANTAAGIAIVPTDFDNRRDVDLLILPEGSQPMLYRNMRDGTFRDVAAASRLPQDKDYTAVAAADINKDGYTDFFFARAGASGVFAMSDGQGALRHAVRVRPDRPARPPRSSSTTTTTACSIC